MSNKYWVITEMDCKPVEDNLQDVVVTIHADRLYNVEIEGKTYNARWYGTASCPLPNGEDFTPYDQLTYEQVCGWLDNLLPVVEIDLNLDAQIENQVNPPIITLPLPFSNP
jgi:hypothetical protein